MLRRVLVVLAGVLVLGGLGAGSALGAVTFSFDGQLAPSSGTFGEIGPNSVAVDDANGDTYVADSASGAVDVFDTASGAQLAGLEGVLTPTGSFGGHQVEVAANDGTGDVYVLDSTDDVVDVFGSTGAFVCQITGRTPVSTLEKEKECNGAAGSATPAGGFVTPGGIAVDQATGDVYVVDAEHGVVDVFGVGGAYLRQILLASVPGGYNGHYTRSVAVDDFNGGVYVADSFRDAVYEFNATGEWVTTWTGANTPAQSFGGRYVSVAADDTGGEVYVTDSQHAVTDVFEPTGGYVTQFGKPIFLGPRGTAVDQGSRRVYVSDTELGVMDIFGPPLTIPDVRTGASSNPQKTGVTLNGTVNPDGVPITSCVFEYGPEASYGQAAPCAHDPGSGTSPVAVSATVTGLQEGAVYHYRLVAKNANGASEGVDREVTLPSPPSIDSASAVDVLPGSADLQAAIDPHAAETTYRFEYGTSTAYGTTVPVPDGTIPSGLLDHTVTQTITGLQPNTTYHWRVIAQNVAGTTTGLDHTFIYDTSGEGLPDGRVYEMVTPPGKNGAQVGSLVFGATPDVSEDGSRVVLTGIQCFAGSGACTADRIGAQGNPFLFTRTNNGWMTTPLAPPATQFESNEYRLGNAETGTALFALSTPPFGEDDIYVNSTDGSVIDIGPVTPPADGPDGAAMEKVLATADFSHVVYAPYNNGPSNYYWPFDPTQPVAVGQYFTLYEYTGQDNKQPVLVGVSGGPGSTEVISVCGARMPADGETTGSALSADGGTVYFDALQCAAGGSGRNAGVPVPAEELYARIDESRTTLISGRSPTGCTSAECLGSPPGNAEFMDASADGSKAFFTSEQQLTNNASEGNTNLYEYDFANPAGDNLLDVSAGDTSGGGPQVQGVAAVSADGSHVYFVARGVLITVANSQGQVARAGANNLYVFERDASYPAGRLSFIATLTPKSDGAVFGLTGGNVAGSGVEANVTPDGRFLVFGSHADLTADDTSTTGAQQVFRYDAQTGVLVRVSIGERGFNDDGNAGTGNAIIVTPLSRRQSGSPGRLDPTMSDDGSFVFFQSPVGLTPHALNDVPIDSSGDLAQNVYEWHEGQVYLISDGKDTSVGGDEEENGDSAVHLLGSDGSGANVFFTTADRLVPQDTDTQVDVYDARIGGGFPYAAPVAGCGGEACRGAPEGSPLLGAPVSATFSGAGNPIAASVPFAVKKKVKPTRRSHKKKTRARKRGAKGRGARKAQTGKHVERGGK